MSLTFYVAGASSEMERCERAMAQLEALGLTNALDWVAEIRRVGGPSPAPGSPQRLASAIADWHAARGAHIFWLLAPPPTKPSTGCWVELGMRIENMRSKFDPHRLSRTLISGDAARCIFASMVTEFDTDEQALESIRAWAVAPARR